MWGVLDEMYNNDESWADFRESNTDPALLPALDFILIQNAKPTSAVYLDICTDWSLKNTQKTAKVKIELDWTNAPIPAYNFWSLCTGQNAEGYCYCGTLIHLVDSGCLRGGDVVEYNGLGSASVFHDGEMPSCVFGAQQANWNTKGNVLMVIDPDQNAGSQFVLITKDATGEVDGDRLRYVGRVTNWGGLLEKLPKDKPPPPYIPSAEKAVIVVASGAIPLT